MPNPHPDPTLLEDAEALRLLWEEVEVLASDALQLADLGGRLTHTVRRFAETYAAGQAEDPRRLLLALGALLEQCTALNLDRVGVEDALGALRFAFVPNPTPHAAIQDKELATLRERLGWRRRGRARPGGGHPPSAFLGPSRRSGD